MSYREARIAAGLSIKEVSKNLGVSRVSVWNWESGNLNPKLETLKKLSNLYGVTVDELLREGGNKGAV